MVEIGKKMSAEQCCGWGSWGTACPITLLRKGYIIKTLIPRDFHMSGPQVWPGVFGAAHHQSKGGSIAKIKNSLKVRSMGHRAASSRTAPRCLLTKGSQTAEVELAVTRQKEHILPPLLSCVTGCVIWGTEVGEGEHDGVWRNLKKQARRDLEILKRLLQFKNKISISDTGLVSCCEPGPGLICPPVIVLGIWHLHVVTESDENFGLSQLLYSGPLAQLEQEQKKKSLRTEN